MPWVRLDDEFPWHPKILAAGPLALAVHVRALCWASRYLTDGFIPKLAIPFLVGEIDSATDSDPGVSASEIPKILVAQELWEETDGGWLIHDYKVYNPSKRQILADRKAASKRMRDVRKKFARTSPKFAQPRSPAPTPKDQNLKPSPTASGDLPLISTQTAKNQPHDPDGFLRFWSAYPRKVSKGNARKAWLAARKKRTLPPLDEILRSLEQAKRSEQWLKEAGMFIPYPATWLNAEGWSDDLKSSSQRSAEDIAREFEEAESGTRPTSP